MLFKVSKIKGQVQTTAAASKNNTSYLMKRNGSFRHINIKNFNFCITSSRALTMFNCFDKILEFIYYLYGVCSTIIVTDDMKLFRCIYHTILMAPHLLSDHCESGVDHWVYQRDFQEPATKSTNKDQGVNTWMNQQIRDCATNIKLSITDGLVQFHLGCQVYQSVDNNIILNVNCLR